MEFLSILFTILCSTLTYAENKPNILRNPPYIAYIWRKSLLIAPHYESNFCSGILVREDVIMTNRDCIIKYSRDPRDFIITAGPEIYRPFFNGATINYCKDLIFEGSPIRGSGRVNSAMFIVTTPPFSISNRIQIIPLSNTIFPVGTHCLVHRMINKTEDVKGITMSTYVGKIIDTAYCPHINSAYQYCIERTTPRKNPGPANNVKHTESYVICEGYLAGVSFGSQVPMENDIVDRTHMYEYFDLHDDSDKKLKPVVLIMLFVINTLLTILD